MSQVNAKFRDAGLPWQLGALDDKTWANRACRLANIVPISPGTQKWGCVRPFMQYI